MVVNSTTGTFCDEEPKFFIIVPHIQDSTPANRKKRYSTINGGMSVEIENDKQSPTVLVVLWEFRGVVVMLVTISL